MMKKVAIVLLKTLGWSAAALVLLLVTVFLVIQTDYVQNRLMQRAVTMLSDRLQTEVHLDHINISILKQSIRLSGLEIEDLQHRKMLQMEDLYGRIQLAPLLNRELVISQARISGLEAFLYKPSPDSAANYQFLIDVFKKERKAEAQPASQKPKHVLKFDVDRIKLERIHVTYNQHQFNLNNLLFRKKADSYQANIDGLGTNWLHNSKKGPVDNRLYIGHVHFTGEKNSIHTLDIDSLNFITDNHKPRKNTGKPKRGFFDPGHMDVVAHLKLNITHLAKDSVMAELTRGRATDRGSGLDVTDLRLKAAANKRTARLKDIIICLPHTKLTFDNATLHLPSKRDNTPLRYTTSVITGSTQLRDIAKPFAPVLKNFTQPLHLQTTMQGDIDGMKFGNIVVKTPDNRLRVNATGGITNLRDKYKLNVTFHVSHMYAKQGTKEKIINQFPVKKFMMKQLHTLGDITYTGQFSVLWKKEQFSGLLGTQCGNADFHFALDETNKYVFGTVHTDSFELGKAMDMPDLGKIVCRANFKFDISKPRTAQMRRLKGGKLPIGHVDAEVAECRYKKIKVRHIVAEINSDGAVAEGNLAVKGKHIDVLCSFSFTNTNEMTKTKIKPGIKFHKLTDEDRAEKAERKAAKKEAKALRKAEKKQEREARKAEREAKKAEEAAEKEARKAIKQQEKEARNAAKQQEKEARKAEREAKKAQRKAEREARKAAKAAAEESNQ